MLMGTASAGTSTCTVGNVTATVADNTSVAGNTGVWINFTINDTTNTTSWYNITFPSGFDVSGAVVTMRINDTEDPSDWENTTGTLYINVSSVDPTNVSADANTIQYINISNATVPSTAAAYVINVTTNNTITVPLNFTATTPDTTAPVVNTVTLNTTAPNTGDAILVTVNATDEVDVTNVTVGSVELTSPDGNIWNGTITAEVGYHSVNVSAKDAAGNVGWNNSTSYTATTSDATPPIISAVANGTPSVSSVTITWTTDEASDSVVKYGTVTDTYTNSKSDTSMVTSHSITLTGLVSNTTYYFVVNSTDASGNSNESAEHNFTTATAIVRINSWDLPATGSRGTAIGATVNITNTGAETIWFVVSVAGTSTTGESIVGLGTIEVGAGATKDVYVMISVSGDADYAGTYTLYPDVYTFDGYPDVSTLQATGSGDAIVIS